MSGGGGLFRAAVDRQPAGVLAAGLLAGVVVALAVGTSAADTAALVALAAGGAAAIVLLALLVQRWLPTGSLATQVLLVSLGAVGATAAGVSLAAWQMFLSGHDLGVLATVLVLSASVAIAGAIALGRAFRRGVEAVVGQVEALATDHVAARPRGALVSSELRRLSELLARAHGDLVDARARAARLDASRRELISWVSHDLRSPIGAVRAMAEALEDGVVVEPADVSAYHRAIRQEAERFAELVDDLFELARIEAGVPTVDVPFVPLHELVGELVGAASAHAAARSVRLEADLEQVGSQLVVAADLRRALANVLDNAIRHTVSGGTVLVTGTSQGDAAVVAVRDECGGIPDDELQQVFEVAFRGDTARSRADGGGGLGLAIAKGLVEARAGQISVRNHDDGCEFTLEMPAGAP